MADLRPRYRRISLRRPEFTGENRCFPCTVVNLVLTGLIAGGLAIVSRTAAGVFVILALVSIWFRGYFVPGTPTVTKRYFPDQILSWFGKIETAPVERESIDVAGFLTTTGVIENAGGDISITPEFEVALGDAVLDLGDKRAIRTATANFLDVEVDQISFDQGDPWAVRVGDLTAGRWESRAAFVTDLGADQLLETRDPTWRTRSVADRGRMLSAIRACLDLCPVCAGSVRLGRTTVETCCREEEHITATCVQCDAPLFETSARVLGLDG